MFDNRDITILGAGALLAVLCLLLPLPFVGKIAAGFVILAIFMALALVRMGPDRIPLEEWLKRRIRFALSARKFTYQRTPKPVTTPPVRKTTTKVISTAELAAALAPAPEAETPTAEPVQGTLPFPAAKDPFPLTLTVEGVGVYRLMTFFLIVVGAYFVFWLATGGTQEMVLFVEQFRR